MAADRLDYRGSLELGVSIRNLCGEGSLTSGIRLDFRRRFSRLHALEAQVLGDAHVLDTIDHGPPIRRGLLQTVGVGEAAASRFEVAEAGFESNDKIRGGLRRHLPSQYHGT